MQQNSKRLFKYIGRQRRLITFGVLATLLMSIVELFTGAMLKFLTNVVDKFSGSFADGLTDTSKLPLKFSIKNPITEENINLINKTLKGSDQIFQVLLIFCLVYIGLYFLLALFNYLRRVFMNAATQRILQEFKSDIYSKILKLPFSFFGKNKTGDLVSRITYDVATLSEIIDLLIEVARAGIYILVFVPVMFSMSWQLSLFTILYFPLSIVLINFITQKIKTVSKSITDNVGDYTAFLEEKINRFKLIKIFGKEKQEKEAFDELVDENFEHNLHLIRLKFSLNPGSDLLGMILLTVVYIYYTFKVTEGATSLGDIVFFIYLVSTAYKPVKKVAQAWGQLHVALVSTRKIFRLLDEPEEQEMEEANNGKIIKDVEMLEFKHVNFSYPDVCKPTLFDINFTANKGDIIGITGKTGAGKSTLLNLIPRFYYPEKGRININGESDWPTDQIRKSVLYLGSDCLLINGTIRENIEYGGCELPLLKEQEYCDLIGLNNTDELNRNIGNGGIHLSEGQRQKVAFLRVILCKPRILILDEVFSSIDKEDIDKLFNLCKAVDIVFVVSRKTDVLAKANKLFVMENGELKKEK